MRRLVLLVYANPRNFLELLKTRFCYQPEFKFASSVEDALDIIAEHSSKLLMIFSEKTLVKYIKNNIVIRVPLLRLDKKELPKIAKIISSRIRVMEGDGDGD